VPDSDDTNENDNNASSRNSTTRTGTAPGAGRRSTAGIRILQPSLDMPPVTCTWCCNWRFGVMILALILYIWGARRTCQRVLDKHHSTIVVYYQYLVLLTLIGLVLMRAVVSEVIRISVRHNLDMCQRLLAKHKNIVMVVGFSWGGAIGAELVAQGILGSYYCENNNNNNNNGDAQTTTKGQAHEPPAVLLIAPTTSLIASLSILNPYRTDAALRIVASWKKQSSTSTTSATSLLADVLPATDSVTTAGSAHNLPRVSSSPSSMTLIQVVHAQGDGCFCPHPERWQQHKRHSSTTLSIGERAAAVVEEHRHYVDLTIIQDENHIFQRSSTQRTLTDIMFHLLRKKGAI
jgi:hypothetical protein